MDKSWMKVRERTQPKYLDGVRNFLQFAFMSKKIGDEIKCPCIKCLNLTNGRKSKVYRHLVMYGIIESYTNWIYHGEILDCMQDESTSDVDENDLDVEDDLDGMFEEAGVWEENFENSEFDSETDNFFKVLSEAKKDLYSGCKFNLLSFILRLLRLKTTYRWSNKSFSVLLEVLKVALPENNILPNSYREAWNIVKGLGHDYKKIHACPNDCMLYWKENENEIQCKRCLLSRYKTGNGDENGSRKIPAKVVRYFPIIPRLKRMFMCSETSSLMRWHAKDRIDDGVLRHPADSLAWKQFDQQHPTFAEDDRSVRLGLATNGFSPFKSMRVSHSIWPVILIPYNLPPRLCMRKDNFLMCLLIDGPKSPGKDIDVYLRLVVDELKELWVGVPTYDSITKQMFIMRAALFGTISDLPGYDMVSGWNTKTELGCPACGVNTDSTWLKHSKKYCFRGHRKFLPENHKYRFDSRSFDGSIECRLKPTRVFGEDLISEMNGVTTEYGKELPLPPKKRRKLNNGNWKKRSVLYELPYWPYILIRHWFDIMHVEKNVCDYIMWTILCIKGKSKDGLNARMDLQKMGIRKALHPHSLGEGKAFLPHASFAMTKKDKDIFYTVLKNAKMPDDFASNISRSITKDGLNFLQLKSHDNHILMELLLPIAVRRCLPSNVSRILIELGNNFKQLYSKVSRPSGFEALDMSDKRARISSKEQSGPSSTSRHSNVLPKKRPLPEVSQPNISLDVDIESSSDNDEDDVESVPSQPIKKKGRGRTKMLPSWGNAPVEVELNELFQPIGDNAAKLASQMGRKVKIGALFPLTVRDWRKMEQRSKDTTWLEFKANFTLEEDYKDVFLKRLGHQWKDWKAHVKKNYYEPNKEDEDALLANRPMEVEHDQWLDLISYWNTDEVKIISSKNKVSRSKQRVPPRTGKNSFAVVKDKMAKEKGEEPSSFNFWMATHVEAAKTPLDRKTEKIVKKMSRLISKDPEAMKSKEMRDEMLVKLLGPERSGKMRSYGYGPTQSQVRILKKQKNFFDNKVANLVDKIRESLKEELKAELGDAVKELVVDLLKSFVKNKDFDAFSRAAGGSTNNSCEDLSSEL